MLPHVSFPDLKVTCHGQHETYITTYKVMKLAAVLIALVIYSIRFSPPENHISHSNENQLHMSAVIVSNQVHK